MTKLIPNSKEGLFEICISKKLFLRAPVEDSPQKYEWEKSAKSVKKFFTLLVVRLIREERV